MLNPEIRLISANMNVVIKVVAGPDAGRVFKLESGNALVVGRGQQSDTQINDPSVSRIHCEIRSENGSLLVSDRGSSSGTFVSGDQIQTQQASIGTMIQVGDTHLRIEDENANSDKTVMPARAEIATAEVRPLHELIGMSMGPFKLTEIVSRSNSGMVFKAIDEEKQVTAAVKVLKPQFTSNDEQRQRFVRAMKTMLPIKHERIVKLHNAGKKGPYCWAAMEFIEGECLADLIERIGIEGMLDWKKVWRVAVDIGQALMTGHDNKIVHRNVTPKNILRRKSDETCLLGDFMLAKALEGTLAQQVTQPGEILGEISYLAPERTKADAVIDTRSDIYGLGATCYALLTGRPPAEGESLTEQIQAVRDEVPPPPKQYQLSVDDMFQDVVMTMIAKDPADRFQTPKDLVKELLRVGKFRALDPGF